MGRHVFGPIHSRRLGLSLGVDLVRAKTCSLDCIYCEAGATTCATLERRDEAGVDGVIAELREVLSKKPAVDFVTFSGAGEPTLNSRIGDVIRFLQQEFSQYRTCLLTNACGFSDPELRRELSGLTLVIPSLDASCEEEFRAINRPVSGLVFETFLAGLQAFCQESTSVIDLELFMVPGINDSDASIRRFCDILRTLRVRKVQLNTLDRPGTDPRVQPAVPETIRRFTEAFSPIVPVEVVGSGSLPGEPRTAGPVRTELACEIRELLAKRDMTVPELAEALHADPALIARILARKNG